MYRILSRHKFCLNFITKFLTFKTFILDLRQILDLRPFVKPFVNSQKNSHHSVPQFMKVRCKKDIDMGKMKMDMCPFTYWRTREIIIHRCCKCHQSLETKEHMYRQNLKGHVSFWLLQCCQCRQSLETKGHMYGQKQKGHVSL